jgi:hypothetical protein
LNQPLPIASVLLHPLFELFPRFTSRLSLPIERHFACTLNERSIKKDQISEEQTVMQ